MSPLSLLAEPAFVIAWYAFGFLAACWTAYDEVTKNTPLKTAMKWAWPIIVLFFSPIGLALYLATARAPSIGEKKGREAERAHHRYEESMLRRVNGAVIHCVAGDGLGIMSAMVIARVTGMTFWQEFWFEYVVGFAFGLFIFQLKSMKMMTDSTPKALAMAFRAESFSMFTVMGGMGAVMTIVTPSIVGAQPHPTTAAFWGFGMLGLLAGFVLTFPMNWMLVKIGWKHGMGRAEDVDVVTSPSGRAAIFAAMVAFGIVGLVLPAWLTEEREASSCPTAHLGADASRRSLVDGTSTTIDDARRALASHDRRRAMMALDDLRHATQLGAEVAPANGFREARDETRAARRAIQDGDEHACVAHLERAASALRTSPAIEPPAPAELTRYRGASVIDARGKIVGEIDRVDAFTATLALGGARDVFGFVDLSAGQKVEVPLDELVFGRREAVGPTLVYTRVPISCASLSRG